MAQRIYTLFHAGGIPLEDLEDAKEDTPKESDDESRIGLIKVERSLSREELAGICVCLYISDLEVDSYMYIKDTSGLEVDMQRLAEDYINNGRQPRKYEISCDGANDEIITVSCKSVDFMKGFMWAADVIAPPSQSGRWLKYTVKIL